MKLEGKCPTGYLLIYKKSYKEFYKGKQNQNQKKLHDILQPLSNLRLIFTLCSMEQQREFCDELRPTFIHCWVFNFK